MENPTTKILLSQPSAGQSVPSGRKNHGPNMRMSKLIRSRGYRRLRALAMIHWKRFKHTRDMDSANNTIRYLNQAIMQTPERSRRISKLLNQLGRALNARFQVLGNLKNLEKAISCWERAAELAPRRYSDVPSRLAGLGRSADRRYERQDELADLEMAIEYYSRAVSLTPSDDSNLPERLSNLSIALHDRFECLGEITDLDKAIEYGTQEVSLARPDHPDLPELLGGLSFFLHSRFKLSDELTDLDRAISHHSEAVLLTPPGRSDLPGQFSILGSYFHTRFERLGNISDLDKSIEYGSRGVSLAQPNQPGLPKQLSDLSVYLHSRFRQLDEPADLDKAIEYDSQALSLTPSGDLDLPGRLLSNCISLHARFERLGEIADLDKAIEYGDRVVSLTPSDQPDLPERLSNLSVYLHSRFGALGELTDLNKAIEHDTLAVSLTPPGHSGLPWLLSNLGSDLHTRFERLGDIEDLDKAIEYGSRAVTLDSPSHPDRPQRLNTFCVSLHTRFRHLSRIEDLDEAIAYGSQAVADIRPDHSELPWLLNNLAAFLLSRFERLGEPVDLDKAIECGDKAVSLVPDGHSGLPRLLSNFGIALYSRCERMRGVAEPHDNRDKHTEADPLAAQRLADDFQRSMGCYEKAAKSLVGSPGDRFDAALRWARQCARYHTTTLLFAYKQVMKILPQLLWLGSPVERRYNLILDDVGSVSTEAAAAAIRLQDYPLALEWLEEGRSIVWKQMLQLRTPVDDLAGVAPALAMELKQVARDLDNASSPAHSRHTARTASFDDTSLEHDAQQHHRLATRYEELVDEARHLPGFERFLLPRKASELMHSARSGPVVVINVHESRCDALVIRPRSTEISHIPLQFSPKQATRSRAQMLYLIKSRGLHGRGVRIDRPNPKAEFKSALGRLWADIVKPILDFLGYLKQPSTGYLPQITWCTTGPLSFLPLHAAGDYNLRTMIFDYVISSYTPTISALLSSERSKTTFSGILAVGQEFTPNMPALPGTVAELTRIQETAQGLTVDRVDGNLATPAAVITGMEQRSWVHLACHASQNSTDPLQSAFYLHGGTLDLATITQKQLKNADLAFLSACQTATGDESLSEEAVHLAAGMLMAGYRTVIATMWSIGDKDAPLIAEKVYEHLLKGGTPDSQRAAVAVHQATGYLRGEVGLGAFEKWVPYIHIGQ